MVLEQRGANSGLDLNSLVHELLQIDDKRPEPWVAVALYSKMKGEKEKALRFVDKALQYDKRHIPAYHLRGSLLLSLGRADHAVVAYFQANALHRELISFKGLVDAYLAVPKRKEAMCTAKQALQLMPRSASAITLVGRVLAQSPDGYEKAKVSPVQPIETSSSPPLLSACFSQGAAVGPTLS
jgi:anaphase-promoting complex subunit 7